MKQQDYLTKVKEYQVLKLHLIRSKAGVVSLKTLSETTISRAGGYGYDKVGQCFKSLFEKLGFNTDICYTKFNLFDYSIEQANQFLKENNINYKVFYKTEINNKISFIELTKIN
jgi:hypothetical protein